MKKFILFILVLMIVNCASSKKIIKTVINQDDGFKLSEKVIWSSSKNRPDWTINEPESVGKNMYFIGLSEKNATEKLARESAKRNASISVVNFLGTSVKNQFQEITTKFGLTSEIVDPTIALRGFIDILSAGLISRLKSRKYYLEKWLTNMNEVYFKAYLIASIPKSVIEDAYKNIVNKEKYKLKDKIRKENNIKAKIQMINTLKAFDKINILGLGK